MCKNIVCQPDHVEVEGKRLSSKTDFLDQVKTFVIFRSRISVKKKTKPSLLLNFASEIRLEEMKLKLMAFACLEGRRDLSRLMGWLGSSIIDII